MRTTAIEVGVDGVRRVFHRTHEGVLVHPLGKPSSWECSCIDGVPQNLGSLASYMESAVGGF